MQDLTPLTQKFLCQIQGSPMKQFHKSPVITTLAGLVGNTLEWYDFLLYAYFAPIIAPLFFPAKTYFLSLVMVFGVFALGFLVRPIGALVIGRWGDIYGRKRALIFTISLMTLPTVAIGILPSYQAIGIAAPLLLTMIRCLQGFAVSGEFTSSGSFLVEHAHPNRRGYAGSLIYAGAFVGIVLGAGIATLQAQVMSPELLKSWGWRIPFLLAGVFGLLGLALRLLAIESPQFAAIKNQPAAPIKTLLTQHRSSLLRAVGLTVAMGIANYFLIGYFTTYLTGANGLQLKQAMLINVLSMIVFIFAMPFFGFLSDKVGRRPVFMVGCIAFFICQIPVFWLLSYKTFAYALIAELIFVILLATINGVVLTCLAELFPTEVRITGAALGYNISVTIFGGTAPLVALWLTKITHTDLAPAWYLMAGIALSFITILFTKETYRQPL